MRVFCTLREWIIYGTLKSGERLIDQELSDYFEVSRTPVREAIQMLEAQKLVQVFPNKATVVSAIDIGNPEKWYLPLANIHALAAELACQNITDEQLENLRKIDQQIMVYVSRGDVVDTLHEDMLFHDAILAVAGNEFICEFSETLMTHIQRFEYNFFNQPDFAIQSFNPHHKLLDDLARRDGKAAYDEMMLNWLSSLKRYNILLKGRHASREEDG